MNKFELWRVWRRERSAIGAAADSQDALRAERAAASTDVPVKRAEVHPEPDQEDTVPAAFYRSLG